MKSPAKSCETEAKTEFSPVKKTTKKSSKKILEDSGDEDSEVVDGVKEEKNHEKEHVNGNSKEHNDSKTEENQPTENNTNPGSCSASSDDNIPKRKTGM